MSSIDILGGGNVEPRALEDEMRSAYLDYAMSVIVGRALPDVRDGLKPVHRRVLFSMSENGLGPTRPYRKCASIVGDVMGNYHPHGDSAIYDALVRLAQEFSMRYKLIDGQGNYGSIDDDPPAAMRYCVVGDTRVATPGGTTRIADLAAGLAPDSERDVDLLVHDRLARPVRASPRLSLRRSSDAAPAHSRGLHAHRHPQPPCALSRGHARGPAAAVEAARRDRDRRSRAPLPDAAPARRRARRGRSVAWRSCWVRSSPRGSRASDARASTTSITSTSSVFSRPTTFMSVDAATCPSARSARAAACVSSISRT